MRQRKKSITLLCEVCWKEFKTLSYFKRKTCSQKCFKKLAINFWKHWKQFQKWHSINNWKIPWNKWKKWVQEAWNKWKSYEETYWNERAKELKEISKTTLFENLKTMSNSKKRTKIEVIMKDILENIWVRFFEQYPMLWITISDFYLPDNRIVIYCDWDYWHKYPYWTEKDHNTNKELKNNNFKVLRFWERELLKEQNLVKERIMREIQRL